MENHSRDEHQAAQSMLDAKREATALAIAAGRENYSDIGILWHESANQAGLICELGQLAATLAGQLAQTSEFRSGEEFLQARAMMLHEATITKGPTLRVRRK